MAGTEENIRKVRARLAEVAAACGRRPEEITIIAVSKNFPPEDISFAIDAGQCHFGENRVQEAESKIPHFHGMHQLKWHMIGHLQSNKAHRAAELFDVIHSVDSIKLAQKLGQASLAIGKSLPVLIQVDLGMEETKFGAERAQVADVVAAIANLGGLRLDGLMTIPPFFENPECARPYFAALRELRQSLESEQPGCLGSGQLSMGMSHDFEVAIREGATMVRIGTAIFGERYGG
jgi:pyridoxal phosphate enzyme (YggS family)